MINTHQYVSVNSTVDLVINVLVQGKLGATKVEFDREPSWLARRRIKKRLLRSGMDHVRLEKYVFPKQIVWVVMVSGWSVSPSASTEMLS